MSNLTAWEKLNIIRHKNRPTVRDYIPMIFDEFFECHGDRLYADDRAIIGGVASLGGTPVTVIAQVTRFIDKDRCRIAACQIQQNRRS